MKGMPRVMVRVRAETIADSEKCGRRDSFRCMAAEALKERLPKAKRVLVDLATFRFTMDGIRYIYLTPRPVQLALVAFDRGQHSKPFVFRLRKGQMIPVPKRGTTPSGKAKRRRKNKSRVVVSKKKQTPPNIIANRPPPQYTPRGHERAFGIRGLLR